MGCHTGAGRYPEINLPYSSEPQAKNPKLESGGIPDSNLLDLSSESSIIENLLLLILDEKGRRRLMLKAKSNEELFSLYKAELALRIRNQNNLERYCQVLDQFQEFLTGNPPSPILAKSFLGKWSKQKPATLYKYLTIIKGFLNWYGEDVDLKVRLPRQLPEYIEDDNIRKMIEAVKKKQTHKNSIDRDILLIELAYNSGLRRNELANLKVSDILINENALIVRKGKGMKDRSVPLPSRVIKLLLKHIDGMNPEDKVFNMKPTAISDKIKRIANSAGVNIHAHSLRHGYATRLLEKGANIKAVQELLGHSRIGTTEAYLSLLPKHLRETVDLLENKDNSVVLEKPDNTEPLQMQAIIVVKAVCKPSWGYPQEIIISEYHSHFVASNEGNSPAIEIEMALLDSSHKLLEGMRETYLGIGEKIEFQPILHQPSGRYYILCQYRKVTPHNADEICNQTWLPFYLSISSKEGEIYVTPGEMEFKFGILKNNKINIFAKKLK